MQSKNKIRDKLELSSNSNSELQLNSWVQCQEGRDSSEEEIASWIDWLSEGNSDIHGWDEEGKGSTSKKE